MQAHRPSPPHPRGGIASWVFTYGRSKKITLGRSDVLPPTQARELAHQVIGDKARGKDPVVERRKRQAGNLRQFLDKHYGPWVTANRKTGGQTLERVTGPDPIWWTGWLRRST